MLTFAKQVGAKLSFGSDKATIEEINEGLRQLKIRYQARQAWLEAYERSTTREQAYIPFGGRS